MWRILMYLKEWWIMLRPAQFKFRLHREPLPHVHFDFELGWSRQGMKWLLKNQAEYYRDAFYQMVVWNLLPKKLVMWAGVRMMAHASTGRWGNQEVGTISMMEMLQRWDEQNGSAPPPAPVQTRPTESKQSPGASDIITIDGYTFRNTPGSVVYVHPVPLAAPTTF